MTRQRAIVVLGAHRSGTSAVASVLNAIGVYLGSPRDLMKPLADNPEGFWEHERIVDINNRTLGVLGRTWDTALPMADDWWVRERFEDIRREAIDLVRSEFGGRPLWGWKDPRTALLLPFWADVLTAVEAAPAYILVIRHPLDVATSLYHRDAFGLDKSLALWVEYVLRALEYSEGSERTIILYDDLIDNPESTLNRLRDFIDMMSPPGLRSGTDELHRILKPGLRHHRTADATYERSRLPPPVRRIYQLAVRAANQPQYSKSNAFRQAVGALRQEYAASTWLMRAAIAPSARALHVFWVGNQEPFREEQSVRCPLVESDQVRLYEFSLPGGTRSIRIDPGHQPARIDIISIEVQEEGAAAAKRVLDLADIQQCVDGETLVGKENGGRSLLALGSDPHIVFRDIATGNADSIRLRVAMRTKDFIPTGAAALMTSILKIERLDEIHALTARLKQTDAALHDAQRLAFERLDETQELRRALETEAALRQQAEKNLHEIRQTRIWRIVSFFFGRMYAQNKRE